VVNLKKQACPERSRMEPILGKGKSKKAKGKMSVNPEFLRLGAV
jgi:hypothetical protein